MHDTLPENKLFDINVTQNFTNWYKWGFINMCIGITTAVITSIGIYFESTSRPIVSITTPVLLCGQAVSGIFWNVYGWIWRWGHPGKICSGREGG